MNPTPALSLEAKNALDPRAEHADNAEAVFFVPAVVVSIQASPSGLLVMAVV